MNSPLIALDSILFVFVAVAAVFELILPGLARSGLWFAVTVSPDFLATPEARSILRRYRMFVLAATVAAFGVVALAAVSRIPLLGILGVLVQIAGLFTGFQSARRLTLPHAVPATTVREAALRRPETRINLPLQLGPFAALGASTAWVASRAAALPERLPAHWNLAGEVDRYASKSFGALYGPAVIGTAMVALLWILSSLMADARRVNATGAMAAGETIFRNRMRSVLLVAEYFIAIVFSVTGVLIAGGPRWPVQYLPMGSVVLVLLILVMSLQSGQGGSRYAPADAQTTGDRTSDANWKWGIFYVNADDPAMVVEKRFGVGYTINFARPGAWAMLLAFIMVPLALVAVLHLR